MIKRLLLKLFGIKRWISVDEYLPNDFNKEYLVCSIINDKTHVFTAYRDRCYGWTNGDTWYDFENNIKYWMEIKYPKIPKQKTHKI